MIDHMMQEEFLRFCTHDVNRPITEHRTPADEVTGSSLLLWVESKSAVALLPFALCLGGKKFVVI